MARRRVRVRSGTGGNISAGSRDLMNVLADSIAKDMKEVVEINARIAASMLKLEATMGEKKLSMWESELADVKTITPPTRAQNKIDVRAFWDATSFDDFVEAASVPMASAKKVMTGKELDKVTIHGRTAQKPDFIKVIPK